MTIPQMLKILQPHIIKHEKVNSNNGWGFDGAIKTVYYLDKEDLTIHKGSAYYRHAPSSKFCILRDINFKTLASTPKKIQQYLIFIGYDELDI